jgi:hypothetical protein
MKRPSGDVLARAALWLETGVNESDAIQEVALWLRYQAEAAHQANYWRDRQIRWRKTKKTETFREGLMHGNAEVLGLNLTIEGDVTTIHDGEQQWWKANSEEMGRALAKVSNAYVCGEYAHKDKPLDAARNDLCRSVQPVKEGR